MRLIKTIAAEIWGLFVDDGAFALAVVVWLALSGIAAHRLAGARWLCPVFVAGLVALLAVGAWRQAARMRK